MPETEPLESGCDRYFDTYGKHKLGSRLTYPVCNFLLFWLHYVWLPTICAAGFIHVAFAREHDCPSLGFHLESGLFVGAIDGTVSNASVYLRFGIQLSAFAFSCTRNRSVIRAGHGL